MRQRPKYKLPQSRKRERRVWLWVLAGIGIGCLGVIAWRFAEGEVARRLAQREKTLAGNTAAATPAQAPARTSTQDNSTAKPGRRQSASSVPPATTNPGPTALAQQRTPIQPAAISTPPAQSPPQQTLPGTFPRPAATVLEVQVALARANISPGSIDGVRGSQTRAALRAFQSQAGLAITGDLDEATRSRLVLDRPAVFYYLVTAEDIGRLRPLSETWLGKSEQSALEYESLPELLGELGRASPALIRRLNPDVRWPEAIPGLAIQMPDTQGPVPAAKAAFLVIRLGDRVLQAYDGEGSLMAHFPCSIARLVEKRPVGELHVQVIIPDPNYTFDPDVFPESAEGRQLGRKLVLPPGPNNPVGVAWVGLDRPGYGIHGTPSPEQVGRTESHGCFRLANWNIALLMRLAWIGMPVRVEP